MWQKNVDSKRVACGVWNSNKGSVVLLMRGGGKARSSAGVAAEQAQNGRGESGGSVGRHFITGNKDMGRAVWSMPGRGECGVVQWFRIR